MLAGAERWRKGADARNKALDIRKAQAQALQIKRAETVNRSEKIVGGNTSTGSRTDAGKSSSSKTSNSSPKGNSGTGGTGSGGGGGGRSGGSSRGPAGGGSGGGAGRGQSGTQRKDTKDTKNANGGSGSGAGGKGWKDNATHKSAGGGKDVKNGPAGGGGKGSHVEHKTARETPPARTPKADKTPAAPKPTKTDTTTRTTKTDKAGPPAGSPGADKNTSRTPKAGKETDTCGKASGIDLTKGKKSKGADGKTTPPSSPTPDGTAKAPDAKGGGTKTPPTLKKDSQGRPDTPKRPGKPGSGGPSVNTQPSREAGHRDGIRLGKAVSHAEAYKDGLRDGYRDTRTVAAQEKDRLDKAHAARKTPPPPAPAVPPKPTAPPKPTVPPKPAAPPKTAPPTPATTTKPDLTKPDRDKPTPKDQPMTATPVQVKSINANTLELGNGAARPTINRGEVRTLRNYQNRLKDKTDIMNQVAETTRVLEQHAIEQAKKVINLVELAKGVRGGDKLNAALAKLEEAAKTQAAQAAAINQRATRAADACTALSANVETRYGDMYKAVVNSPETVPAELAYYQEMSNA
jgi:hypothetical protein